MAPCWAPRGELLAAGRRAAEGSKASAKGCWPCRSSGLLVGWAAVGTVTMPSDVAGVLSWVWGVRMGLRSCTEWAWATGSCSGCWMLPVLSLRGYRGCHHCHEKQAGPVRIPGCHPGPRLVCLHLSACIRGDLTGSALGTWDVCLWSLNIYSDISLAAGHCPRATWRPSWRISGHTTSMPCWSLADLR